MLITGHTLRHGDSLYFLWGKNLQCSPNWCMDHLSKVFPFVNKIQPYWAVSVWVLSLITLGHMQSIYSHQTWWLSNPNQNHPKQKEIILILLSHTFFNISLLRFNRSDRKNNARTLLSLFLKAKPESQSELFRGENQIKCKIANQSEPNFLTFGFSMRKAYFQSWLFFKKSLENPPYGKVRPLRF